MENQSSLNVVSGTTIVLNSTTINTASTVHVLRVGGNLSDQEYFTIIAPSE